MSMFYRIPLAPKPTLFCSLITDTAKVEAVDVNAKITELAQEAIS